MPHADDLALTRAADGDERAFDELCGATGARVLALALHLVDDAAAAERIAHDTYVTAWTRARSFDPHRDDAVAWLLAVALERTLAHRRDAAAAPTARTGPAATPHRLSALADHERQAIALALCGMTLAQVARLTAVEPGIAAVRLLRALTALGPDRSAAA